MGDSFFLSHLCFFILHLSPHPTPTTLCLTPSCLLLWPSVSVCRTTHTLRSWCKRLPYSVKTLSSNPDSFQSAITVILLLLLLLLLLCVRGSVDACVMWRSEDNFRSVIALHCGTWALNSGPQICTESIFPSASS